MFIHPPPTVSFVPKEGRDVFFFKYIKFIDEMIE